MNEKFNRFLVKLTLTIPAIAIGLFSAFIFVFKPVIELWFPPEPVQEPLFDVHPTPEVEEIKHEFH